MSELIHQLWDSTQETVSGLGQAEPESLIALIELRDQVLRYAQEQTVLTEDEKRMLQQIGEFDAVIVERMQQLRDEASNQIQKIRKTRMQKQVYEKAYDYGSFFVDRRK
ncbi:hypothetical protein [Paenibacillus protaetiae]|uniref:Flagellar protein FliT n=1 Tax=Paenibacillus protaetiae TaxID=2509456 RepID=A0A4V0YFH8_9BACL|nr:hypothetical protein [Paenibacillus protaetiae]QAY67761.1 hypothetical protein ET464_16580 [Paenibacillus protaetiae]